MARASVFVGFVVASLLLACGGGSSPSEPDPVPDSLTGTWRGEMSGSVGDGAFSCALEVDLSDADSGIFIGDWSAQCPGATVAGVMAAVSIANFTLLTALGSTTAPATHPLGTCGWGASVTLQGNELSGDWEAPENCEDASLTGGPLRLRFAG